MEGSNIPALLEEVFSGRPDDPQKHKSSIRLLHDSLSSSVGNQKIAQSAFPVLNLPIAESDSKYFSNYLKSLQSGTVQGIPSLGHLHIATPSAVRASKLFHALSLLSLKKNASLYSGFLSVKRFASSSVYETQNQFLELEVKRLQCSRLVANLKVALGKNMQKTMTLWQISPKPTNSQPKVGARGIKRRNTMNAYGNKDKILKIIKAILKASPIFEQSAFWRWKFTMQAQREKEQRLKHATELSEYITRYRSLKEAFGKFKQKPKPKWEIYKERLLRALIQSKLRDFCAVKISFNKWKMGLDEEVIEEVEEEEVHRKSMKILKKTNETLRASRPESEPSQRSQEGKPADHAQLYKYSLLRSVFKYLHYRTEDFFKRWAVSSSTKKLEDKKKKTVKFIDILHKGLKKNVAKSLTMPPEPKSRETILTNALLTICKNIIYVKSRLFNMWARAPTSAAARFQAYLLKNLSKIPKKSLQSSFSSWKATPKNIDAPRLFGMIVTLQRIFANKGKRVFHPPYIVKNADEIMRRTIKKIRGIIHNLYDSAFTRWHYHSLNCYYRKKASVFYRSCELAANPVKNALSIWREKVHAKDTVKRTSGTSRMVKILEKCFRARYKMLLFKSYMRPKPKKVLFQIFNLYNRKYCDFTRNAFALWKLSTESSEGKDLQIYKDSATFSIFRIWTKSVQYRIKRGLYAFMKNNKHRKVILIRGLINSWKSKKLQAWDRLKALSTSYKQKFKALKMQTALKRAGRRPQKYGFKKFLPPTSIKSALFDIYRVFLSRAQYALYKCRLFGKATEVHDARNVTKGLRKDMKKEKLRSTRAAARSFIEVLRAIPKRTLNTSLRRMLIDDDQRMKSSFKSLISVFVARPKEAMSRWYKFMHSCKTGDILDRVKAEKLKGDLIRIVLRSIRDSFQRIEGAGDKIKGGLKSIIKNIEKKTRFSLVKWRKYVYSCKHGDLFDAIRSQKLKIHMVNMQKRTIRDSVQRVLGAGDKIKGSIKSIIRQIEKRQKVSVMIWKNYTQLCKQGKLLNAIKSEKLKTALFKVPARTMRDAFQRVAGGGDKIKGALKSIVRNIERKTRHTMELWKKYIYACKHGDMYDAIRSQKLKFHLTGLQRRTARDSFQRIAGGGDKIKGALKSIVRNIERKARYTVEIWKKYVYACKHGDMYDAIRSQKLKIHLTGLQKRTARDSFQRILGAGDRIKGSIKSIIRQLEKRKKVAYSIWSNFTQLCKHGKLLNAIKSEKLKTALFKVPARTMRDAFQRLAGGGDKIKGALKSIVRNIERKTRHTMELWKKYIYACKHGDMFDAIRSQKLKIHLTGLQRRTARDSFQRVLGAGDRIKGSIRSIIRQMEKRKKVALSIWASYTQLCRHGKLLNAIKSERLKAALFKVPARTMRDAFQRVAGGGDKIKGALKSIVRNIERKSKHAIELWKKYIYACKHGDMFDAIRSQKLKHHLSGLPRRTTRDTFQRVLGAGDRIKGSIKSIIRQLEKRKNVAFSIWTNYTQLCVHGKLLNAIKSEKLKAALFKVPARTMRDAFQRLAGGGDKIKGALKSIVRNIEKKTQFAIQSWKKYIYECKHGDMFDAMRSQKLKYYLTRIPTRTLKDSAQRIYGAGDKIKGSIKNIIRQIEKRTKVSVSIWKTYTIQCQQGKLLNAIKSEKLKAALFRVPARTMRDSFQRVVGGGDKIKGAVRTVLRQIEKRSKVAYGNWKEFIQRCKQGDLMDGIKSQKLKISLGELVKRTTRDSTQRILGAGNKIKGVIDDIIKKIERRPHIAFLRWRNNFYEIKKGVMLDAIKTEKLKSALMRVPIRTLRNGFQLIIGSGDVVKGALNVIVRHIERKPKIVLKRWNKVIEEIKMGVLMDACRSQQLKNALNKLPRRILKDSSMRIIGSSDKVSGALRTLKHRIEKRTTVALRQWKTFVLDCHRGKVLDFLRAFKLNSTLSRIPKRVMRNTYSRIQGQGNLLAGVFRNLENKIKNIPRLAFIKWKDWFASYKKGMILDAMRAEKLKHSLRKIPNRVLKDSFQRVLGNGSKVAGALNSIFRTYKGLMAKGLAQWKFYIDSCHKKRIMDAFRTEKLKSSLFRLTLKTLKTTTNKIIGMGNAVKGALERIFLGIEKMQKIGFSRWTKFVELCKSKVFMDNVRSSKLKIAMQDIVKRTLRMTVFKVVHDKVNAKKAISYIFFVIKQKARTAFTDWRIYVLGCRNKMVLDNLTSQKMKIALSSIPVRTLRNSFDRIIGEGDRVKGALKDLMSKLMNRPKFAMNKWKTFIKDCKTKGLMDNIRSARLKIVMIHLLSRSLRNYVSRVVGQGSLVQGALKKIFSVFRNKPRAAIQRWVKFGDMIDKKQILDSLKSQKLHSCLVKIPNRTLKTGFERIIGNGDIVKGALRRLLISFKNLTKSSFDLWNKFRIGCATKTFLDNIKSQRLKSVMSNIPRRVIKDAYQRIVGDGSKVKGAMRTFINNILQMPRTALKTWRSYVNLCRSNNMMDAIRSHKLQMALTRIPRRVLRDCCQRVIGGGDKIKGMFKTLMEAFKSKPRHALKMWTKYVEGCKTKGFMDNIRSEKLKHVMSSVTKKTIKDSFLRIAGEGDKVKGAMKMVIRGIMKRPKVAVDKWKAFVSDCKAKGLFNAVISQKLKGSLVSLQRRTTRNMFEKVIGAGNRASGAMKRIFMAIDKKSKLAFIDWKNFIVSCKTKGLLDNIRSHKLQIALTHIPKRTLNDIFMKITKSGSIAMRVMRRLGNIFIKGPEIAFKNWKKFVEKDRIVDVKNDFEKKFKAMKVKNSIDKPVRKVLRSAKSHADHDNTKLKMVLKTLAGTVTKRNLDAFRLWHISSIRTVLVTANSGLKLKESLNRICRKTLKDVFIRVYPVADKVKLAIGKLESRVRQRPKFAIFRWVKYADKVSSNELLSSIKTLKLRHHLEFIVKRTLRTTNLIIIGDGDRVKGALKSIMAGFNRKMKTGLLQWKSFVQACREKKMYDSMRSHKIKHIMKEITVRTLRDASERILGGGDKIKGAIRRLLNGLIRLPKNCIDKWKLYVLDCKSRGLFDAMRSHKLKNCFERLPKRILKDASNRIFGDGDIVKSILKAAIRKLVNLPKDAIFKWKLFVSDVKTKRIMDNLRSQRLLSNLNKIPLRTMRNVCERVLGEGNLIKGAIRRIQLAIQKKPKIAFGLWAKFVDDIKKKKLYDNARSTQLKICMTQIVKRSERDAFLRISGGGNKIKGMMQDILSRLNRIPKLAIDQWKKYLVLLTNKKFLDNIKSEKLKSLLSNIARRRMRDCSQRLLGEGDKIKGALKRMTAAIAKRTLDGYQQWKKYIIGCKHKDFFDALRSSKLKIALSRLPTRNVKGIFNRIIGGGNAVEGLLKTIFAAIEKLPQIAFKRWRAYMDDLKHKRMFDMMRSHKLKSSLSGITKRTLLSTIRLFDNRQQLMIVKKTLKEMMNSLSNRNRNALILWKSYVQMCKDKTMLDMVRTEKLRNSLMKIPIRVAKDAYNRVVGGGDVIKGKLEVIFSRIEKLPQMAYGKWKKFVIDTKTKGLLDNLKSLKLKQSLVRLVGTNTRGTFLRVIGGGSKAIGMLKALAAKALAVPRDALKSWKRYINDIKLHKLLESTKALKLKGTMSHMILRTIKTVTHRITVGNPNVKTAINTLLNVQKEGKKQTMARWKKYVDDCKKSKLFDMVRTERLRKHLNFVTTRKLKMSLERILGDGNAAKGALRRIMMATEKIKSIKFQQWKKEVVKSKEIMVMKKLKAIKFKELVTTVTSKQQKTVISTLTCKQPKSEKALLRVFTCLKIKQIHSFRDWKEKVIRMSKRENVIIQNFRSFSSNVPNRVLKAAFNVLMGKSKAEKTFNRIIANWEKIQKEAISILWGRVEKLRTIRKVNSAYYVFRGLLSYSKKVLALRFRYWKNLDAVRRARIMKKTTGKMMSLMSINFEGAFWKWKYIMTHTGAIINPKHSIVLNRLSKVGNNYQRRLSQFAFFKFILFFKSLVGQKLTLPQALAKILKSEADPVGQTPEKESRPVSIMSAGDLKANENPSNVSTLAGLSKEEVSSMNQLGAFEIVSMTIKEIRLRKVAWALSAMFTYSKQVGFYDGERSRLIEQITELRYEKHSLLEDNNTLRHHNDSLVNSLEKANEEFQTLSLHLDHLRLTAMVRILSRMAEFSMHTAFVGLSFK